MEAGIKDSSQPASKAEEEAMKRNTDCVYFLASPLTCKKGSECEYRHSEYARVNPRDCRYWLNGNCLNPKCSFRHPPLDGLLGTTVTPEGLSSTTLQSASLTQPPAAPTPAYNSSKQAVPCIYYQKGLCLKGDRCSFKHGVKPINNAAQQPPAPKIATSFSELQSLMKGPSLQKCTQQPKIPQMNTIKSDKLPPPLKPASRVETAPLKDGALTTGLVPFTASNDELHRYKPINVPLIISGNSVSRPHRNLQVQVVEEHSFHNGREAGEILGESSPGFDVLVDDELEDSEYYYNEHKRRHLDSGNEFTHRRSVDYTSLTKPYNDALEYDKYGHVQDRYAIEQRRASAERISETPSMPVKRVSQRSMSPNQIYESDLRYRLSKQSRVTGSRSVVSPDRRGDFYLRDGRDSHVEEKRQRGYSERGSHHLPSRGNRFHGRIKLPGRLVTEKNHNGFILQREMERGRKWGLRLSPSNPPPGSFHQERHQDRLKQRVQENFVSEARNLKGRMIRSYDVDIINPVDFAAPKSLAELKGSKVSVNNREQIMNPLGEKKNTGNEKFVGLEESEGSLPFEGPKPLNRILKRKREGESVDSGSGIVSGKESERNLTSKTVEEEAEEGLISTEGEKVSHEDHSSYTQKEGDLENEDEMMIDEAMEDEEFDHGEEEEYDYEGEVVEEFKAEEEENAEAEEEYFDDGEDDEEDFAKRIGLLLN